MAQPLTRTMVRRRAGWEPTSPLQATSGRPPAYIRTAKPNTHRLHVVAGGYKDPSRQAGGFIGAPNGASPRGSGGAQGRPQQHQQQQQADAAGRSDAPGARKAGPSATSAGRTQPPPPPQQQPATSGRTARASGPGAGAGAEGAPKARKERSAAGAAVPGRPPTDEPSDGGRQASTSGRSTGTAAADNAAPSARPGKRRATAVAAAAAAAVPAAATLAASAGISSAQRVQRGAEELQQGGGNGMRQQQQQGGAYPAAGASSSSAQSVRGAARYGGGGKGADGGRLDSQGLTIADVMELAGEADDDDDEEELLLQDDDEGVEVKGGVEEDEGSLVDLAGGNPNWDPWREPRVVQELQRQDYTLVEELSSAKHIVLRDDFLPVADALALRGVFDERFANPRSIHPERFLWDYWHVPDQYTLVRTQAQVYFPEELYERLEDALLSYGESQLGCRAISPIWLSYYVDGCVQELHCDNPHGPFAFVLSLTEWDTREFVGGETTILQPAVLNYWRTYDPNKGMELPQLVTHVSPLFNRLTVFDPRFPHGVRQVHGTRDPRMARLVLHGWFTEPSPFFTGPLDQAEAEAVLEEGLAPMWQALEGLAGLITGTLIVRADISGIDGSVVDVQWLADTLVEVPNHDRAAAEAWLEGRMLPRLRALVQHEVRDSLLLLAFPTSADGQDSSVTLPIIFE